MKIEKVYDDLANKIISEKSIKRDVDGKYYLYNHKTNRYDMLCRNERNHGISYLKYDAEELAGERLNYNKNNICFSKFINTIKNNAIEEDFYESAKRYVPFRNFIYDAVLKNIYMHGPQFNNTYLLEFKYYNNPKPTPHIDELLTDLTGDISLIKNMIKNFLTLNITSPYFITSEHDLESRSIWARTEGTFIIEQLIKNIFDYTEWNHLNHKNKIKINKVYVAIIKTKQQLNIALKRFVNLDKPLPLMIQDPFKISNHKATTIPVKWEFINDNKWYKNKTIYSAMTMNIIESELADFVSSIFPSH